MTLDEVITTILKLEQEREEIYADSHVTEEEHPRLTFIKSELIRLWDLRRRLEAARDAGLDHIPVPPPDDPSQLLQ